jgi:N-acyl homoserine lactone hydrolase
VHFTRFAYDKEVMLASLDRLAALERAGARILFGHDPEFWATIPHAPTALA